MSWLCVSDQLLIILRIRYECQISSSHQRLCCSCLHTLRKFFDNLLQLNSHLPVFRVSEDQSFGLFSWKCMVFIVFFHVICLSALTGYPLHTPCLIFQWKQEEDLEIAKRRPIQGEQQEGKNSWEKLPWVGDITVGKIK